MATRESASAKVQVATAETSPELRSPFRAKDNNTWPGAEPALTPQAFLVCILWLTQILLSPVYVFESGLPQPADFLMVFLSLVVLLFRGFPLPRRGLPFLGLLVALATYTAIVNGWWYLKVGDSGLLLPSLYYFFNCIVFATFLSLYTWLGRSLISLTCCAFAISALFQVVVSLQIVDISLNDFIRATLLFKNPNQTAYYAVLVGSFMLLCARANLLPYFLRLWMPFFLAQLGYIVALTQSRAGLASLGLIVGLFSIRRLTTGILLGSLLFLLARSPMGDQLIQVISERVQQKQKSLDEELAYRGYARIWQNREYLLFGAGEGAYERFEVLWGKELHSTFGNILMSYGVVGFVIICAFFWNLFRRCGWSNTIGFLPAFAYGLTHNGIRQSEFWMIAALAVCLYLERHRPQQLPESQRLVGQRSSLSPHFLARPQVNLRGKRLVTSPAQ
ncbi:MAG: hypothetical protein NZ899_07785 [Thermoguttaceae bacterium]|nr:hypothetical protein [Thermoguttaceae bacterium]MDW8079042.1 hypothetical protein [Thermoguttaceae bacterium]